MPATTCRIDQLWEEYHRTRTEAAKAELARACMPAIRALARKVRREMGNVPALKELVQAGSVGLLEAIERFDPSRGLHFETWCSWRVLGAMRDDQRKDGWVTHTVRLRAQRLRRAADEMTAALGRPPTGEELAAALGTPVAEVADLVAHSMRPRPLSLEVVAPTEGKPSDPALVARARDPAQALLAKEARARLLAALKGLPDKERYTLLLYYFERLTMGDIARVLDVTESRVSQLHRKALETLARRLGPRKDEFLDALEA